MLMPKLKYPDCEVCQLLNKIGVDPKLINDFHEDKISMSRLPKPARKLLKAYYKRKGWNKNGN